MQLGIEHILILVLSWLTKCWNEALLAITQSYMVLLRYLISEIVVGETNKTNNCASVERICLKT